MYNLTKYETETTILFNDEDQEATVYTCNKTLMKKLSGYCDKYPDQYTQIAIDDYSKTFTVPKRFIAIRQPKTYTEEQKLRMAEHMRSITRSQNVAVVTNEMLDKKQA